MDEGECIAGQIELETRANNLYSDTTCHVARPNG
jgi:hypothetical protein